LDGSDAAMFLHQHGNMTAAVERMAAAHEAGARSMDEIHKRLGVIERTHGDLGRTDHAAVVALDRRVGRLERKTTFWRLAGLVGVVLASVGAATLATYVIATWVL
jgi:hypothetical protein